ncbi:hypothetical protein BU24DRAFT_14092 [Aaosphaeria arxii CBS 175.79]|uniref:Uncharacterized protein n=1 Tax=Aaosphaeria arxii CBS 175.79 TaxID=1450172 RepID=A0A6A5Y8Z3_9PLEO|nr:uncharacterized protein BU24DRAFT_14092 [Aaosphaeria arxii CBS 175.79]KAF2021054.1 hypothetical protein BU24DRAFT_14092 [Aaosphaeria arxii CBS 175.79]
MTASWWAGPEAAYQGRTIVQLPCTAGLRATPDQVVPGLLRSGHYIDRVISVGSRVLQRRKRKNQRCVGKAMEPGSALLALNLGRWSVELGSVLPQPHLLSLQGELRVRFKAFEMRLMSSWWASKAALTDQAGLHRGRWLHANCVLECCFACAAIILQISGALSLQHLPIHS